MDFLPVFMILINWSPSHTFNASRCLSQGDPISPFLFILAVEGMVRYIKLVVQAIHLKGIHLWGNDLPLSHQQFMDDIMLFCQVSLRETRALKSILQYFMQACGTYINNEKSNIFFYNTPVPSQSFLARILGFWIGSLPSKYLEISLVTNSLRTSYWKILLEHIQS